MPSLNPSLRELFEAAIDLPRDARGRFLDAQCPDLERRAFVERMLEASTEPDTALPNLSATTLAQVLGEPDAAPALPPGSRIGPFELVEVLGEGGSSTVFRAQRTVDGVRQEVALKLLRRGLYSPDAQRQFRRERQILSQLRHPGIARLIEGGVTDTGAAYIALDLVEGAPITDYARDHRLDLRQRLLLFLGACRAVDAAHRALIVHRDLKPSNVLVTEDATVKLLDFGIAKLLDADDDTQTHLPAFTPAYASPEQRGGGLITTATDVYALGVLLGELMTGERFGDITQRTPSSQISGGHAPGVLPATPKATRRQLRGDLDNIVLKAIDTDPERRYASAGAFADDIQRLLDHRPVAAHPPSTWYRTRKFIARHRGGVATTTLFVLAILAALGIALWQADVAQRQAQLARSEAARANAVRDFIEGMFAPLRYGIAAGKQPSLGELLDAGTKQLDASPQLDAVARVDLLAMFSNLNENLGDLPRARELAERAVTLSEGVLRPTDLVAIRALTARGYAAVRMEDYAAGGIDLREAHRRMLAQGVHGEVLIDLLEPLGAVENIEGHGEVSLALAREALAERIATWGPDDRRVGTGYNDVASQLEGTERYDEAATMWQRTYRFQLAHWGTDSNETSLALAGWASAEFRAGHWAQANDLFGRALALYARNGNRPQITEVYAAQKACFLAGLRDDRAVADTRCGLARQLSASGFGADSALYGDSLESAAFGAIESGDLRTARTELVEARQRYGSAVANRMRNGRADSELAGIALLEGDPARARELLPNAIAELRTRPYKVLPLLAEARLLLACSRAPGPQCPANLRASVARDLGEVANRDDPMLLRVEVILARIELERGEADAAYERLGSALDRYGGELPAIHPRRIETQLWISIAAARSGDCATAANEVARAGAVIATRDLAGHPLLGAAHTALRDAGWCGPLVD